MIDVIVDEAEGQSTYGYQGTSFPVPTYAYHKNNQWRRANPQILSGCPEHLLVFTYNPWL